MVSLKKRKVGAEDSSSLLASSKKFSASKIFSPFRTIGLVCDATPLAVTSLGQSFTITTCVGRSFQIFDASTLHLLFVSSQAPEPIRCLYSHFHYVFAAWGTTVGIYKRGKLEGTIETNGGEIDDLVVFGEYLCFCTSSGVHVYKISSKDPTQNEFYTSYKVPSVAGRVKKLIHMPTYLNKILIVTDSLMMMFNVRSGKVIYEFKEFGEEIAAVEPAPVLDVVAVATVSGKVHLFNVKKNKSLFELSLDERVNTLSFRTDGTAHLGVGTAAGHMFFYDLNSKKRIHSVRNAHDEASGGVANLEFLNGQPIVVSNGGDNLVQEMVFDPTITNSTTAITTPPRVLRSRGGHAKPPNAITFTDEEAHFVLSAAQDQTLWSFSLRKDAQSFEFSQRTSKNKKKSSLHEKFPEITALVYKADKQKRWDNIVTAHQNQTFARSWSGDRGIVGAYNLNTADGGIVKSVTITECGNFALVGSSGGNISIYNLQSGQLRRVLSKAHSNSITGLVVDAVNKTVISVSLDGKLVLHDFKSGRIVNTIGLASSATDLRIHGNLAAVALDDLSIVVYDLVTQKKVRELWGHANRITSFDFTPDGRWIISAALDSTIRTWDLPTGGCIDAVRVPSVVTCLRISPNGEWLATSHVQGVGIQLWTQKAQFTKAGAISRHIDEDEVNNMDMPTVSGEGGANILDGAFDEEQEIDSGLQVNSVDQLSKELLTMSTLPRAKYNTLVHLENIRQRNKPQEAPKKPVQVPFFLGQSSTENGKIEEESSDKTALRKNFVASSESEFTKLLREQNYEQLIKHLKSLSPATTDLEIRSLNTDEPLDEIVRFIDALTFQLQHKRDFEFVQAWMSMLLRVHGDVVLAHGEFLEPSLKAWEHVQEQEAERLDALVKYCSGVLSYLRSL